MTTRDPRRAKARGARTVIAGAMSALLAARDPARAPGPADPETRIARADVRGCCDVLTDGCDGPVALGFAKRVVPDVQPRGKIDAHDQHRPREGRGVVHAALSPRRAGGRAPV